MRVPLSLFIGVILVAPLCAGPLQDDREEPIYRGQPAGYWIGRLKAKDWPTCLDGARGLRAGGTAAWPAVPALTEALRDDDADVRHAVVEALGSIGFGANKALPRLAEYYQEANDGECPHALTAMLRIDVRSGDTLKTLRAALESAHPDTRQFALDCSIRVPDLEETEILGAARASLSHPSPDVRKTAGNVMCYLGRAARPALIEMLQGDDHLARAEAIEVLTKPSFLDAGTESKLVPVLAGMLAEDDRAARLMACNKLLLLGPHPAGVTALEKALKDDDPEVRLRAAAALIKAAPRRSAEAVATAVTILREHEKLRDEALQVLQSGGPAAEPAVGAIVELLGDSSVDEQAVRTLGTIGPKARPAVSALVRLAAKDSLCAIEALGKIGPVDDSVVPALIEALTRMPSPPFVHQSAAAALRTIGPSAKAHIPRLRRHLNDVELDARTNALVAFALAGMGCDDDEVIDALGQGADFLGKQELFSTLGALARKSDRARALLLEFVKRAPDIDLQRREGAKTANDCTSSLALAQLLALGPDLKRLVPQFVELLNTPNPYTQVMAFYVVKNYDPDAIAAADKALLQGDEQPTRENKTLAQWLAQAQHHDADKRKEAIRQLALFDFPRLIVPELLERLDDEDDDVQKLAADRLGHHPPALDFLVAASARHDKAIRTRMLGRVLAGDSTGMRLAYDAPLAQLLVSDDPDPFIRLLTACGLRESRGHFDVPALFEAMRQERAIRPAAARLVASMTLHVTSRLRSENREGLEVVVDMTEILPLFMEMTREDDVDQRCAGVLALARFAPFADDSLDIFARTISEKDPDVRRATAEALRRIFFDGVPVEPWVVHDLLGPKNTPRFRRLTKLLIPALKDKVPAVRLAAARSLGCIGPDAALAEPALRQALDDDQASVRLAAAEALWTVGGDRGTPAAVETLRTLLKDEQPENRRAALSQLARIGPPARSAFADVVALARSDRGRLLGEDLMRTLYNLDSRPSALGPLLIEFLQDFDREDRGLVARVIGLTSPAPYSKSAVPLLAKLLFDPDKKVHAHAIYALRQIGPAARDAVPALLGRLREDQFENDRCLEAIVAIIEKNPPKDVLAFLLQQAQDPKSKAFETCPGLVRLLPGLGPESEALLPYMIALVESRRLDEDTFWMSLVCMELTEKSLPELEKLLTSGGVRAAAACWALSKLGPRAAGSAGAIRLLLVDPSPRIAEYACQALLVIEPSPSPETKKWLLQHGSSCVSGFIGDDRWPPIKRNLSKLGPEFNQLLQGLVEALRRQDVYSPDAEWQILEFVAEMGTRSAYFLPELIELQRDEDKLLLWSGWKYEAILSGNDSMSRWNRNTHGNGSPVQNWADRRYCDPLQKFLRAQGKAAIPHLVRYLQDPDPKVRLFAAFCTGLLGPQALEASRELRAALSDRNGFPSDKDRSYRLEILYLTELLNALAAVGPPKGSSKDVAPLLRHKSPMVRATAVWVLSQPGLEAKEALTALTGIADDADSMVALHVALAKLRLKGSEDKAVPEISRFLKDNSPEVRLQAAAGLCRIGRAARPAMDTFRKWAKSDDRAERLLAAEAHWAIAGETQAAVSLCIGIVDNANPDVASVAELLNRIGPAAEPARVALKERARYPLGLQRGGAFTTDLDIPIQVQKP